MRHTAASYNRHPAGTTLTELLIAIVLAGLVVGAITQVFQSQRKAYALQEQVAGMTQQAQAALEIITREVRSAGTNRNWAAFTPVTYISATQFELRSDRNDDGNTNAPGELTIYVCDAANRRITRNAGSGAETLAENIDTCAPFIAGFTSTGQSTTDSNAMRQIRLTVTTRTAIPDLTYQSNGGYRTYTLTSLITLRN